MMSDERPNQIPEQNKGIKPIHEPLRQNLIAQRDQTIRKIEVLMDKLNRFRGSLPPDLVQRISTAYKEAADELLAIDPANPPDAASVYLITTRLQALSLCVTSLFATTGLDHPAPAAHQDGSAGENAPLSSALGNGFVAPCRARPMAEVMELFPGGLQERRLKRSVK